MAPLGLQAVDTELSGTVELPNAGQWVTPSNTATAHCERDSFASDSHEAISYPLRTSPFLGTRRGSHLSQ